MQLIASIPAPTLTRGLAAQATWQVSDVGVRVGRKGLHSVSEAPTHSLTLLRGFVPRIALSVQIGWWTAATPISRRERRPIRPLSQQN